MSTVTRAASPGRLRLPLPRDLGGRRALSTTAMLTPAVLAIVCLVFVPLGLVVRDSFANSGDYGQVMGGFTLSNYADLAHSTYLGILVYSLRVAAVNTVICLVAGYLVSYYICSRPPARQLLLLLLIIIPFWTDFLVRTFALINVIGAGGPLNKLTNALALTHGSTGWVPSELATYIGLLYAFLPAAVFPIYASLRSVDPSLREAAQDLGCGWWRVQTRVLLPLVRQGLLASTLLVFVPTLGVFVIPVLLDGGKRQLVGNLIVTLYTEFRNEPMGAATGVVLLILMLASMLLVGLLSRRLRSRST